MSIQTKQVVFLSIRDFHNHFARAHKSKIEVQLKNICFDWYFPCNSTKQEKYVIKKQKVLCLEEACQIKSWSPLEITLCHIVPWAKAASPLSTSQHIPSSRKMWLWKSWSRTRSKMTISQETIREKPIYSPNSDTPTLSGLPWFRWIIAWCLE